MRAGIVLRISLLFLCMAPAPAFAEESRSDTGAWRYGGILDSAYAVDFNFPQENRWRSKTTTVQVNEPVLNMVMAYVRKVPTPGSRFGLEVGVQGGDDTEGLVPVSIPGRDKPLTGADSLRHVSRANVSYLAPVGNGLTLTAGLFNSYIGYQSIYAKNNLNYTRSYMADNAPYFMFGLGATYPINPSMQVGLYILNGYSYLSHINNQPSYGSQLVWTPTARLTLTQNLYYGPDQSNTAIEFWRLFSGSIIEWKVWPLTLAVAYDIGTENAAELSGHPRTFWTGGALYAHWNVHGPWSLALRPELYWDRNGRLTGSEQLLKAVTTTLEYKWTNTWRSALLRMEYRYDESTGIGGGFFSGRNLSLHVPGVARDQHLLLFSMILAVTR
mgnify:CR=1 FL=1